MMARHSASFRRPFWLLLLILGALITPGATVKHESFKKCSQSGFCKRNRALADDASAAGSAWTSPYVLDSGSITLSSDGILTGMIQKTINEAKDTVNLPLTVTFLESGVARVTIDEEKRQKGDIELRHGSKARKERFNEVEKWTIVGGLDRSNSASVSNDSPSGTTRVLYGAGGKHEAVIKHKPFGIQFKRDGETQVQFNEQGWMNVEHWRPKVDKPIAQEVADQQNAEQQVMQDTKPEEDESTWWEETFGGNTDSKPKGPEAVAMDITFPGYEHVYGIPEHTGPLSLRETRGGEGNFEDPYRLYNTDVFEYITNSPMTLYGAIPLMQAHRPGSTVGVFWLNAAETWVDITKANSASKLLSSSSKTTKTHWVSESGLLDVFVFLGPSPQELQRQYGELTGYTQLPQQFAIAYHQCRWNYVTDDDVRDVDRKFDRHSIPYDAIWLDIEYTEGKKYFTWDALTFDDPEGMQRQLMEHERKLVAIIDPHVKNENGFSIKDDLINQDFAVKNKEGDAPWEGWCWPGASYWIDCFNPKGFKWWASRYYYGNWKHTMKNLFLWNDMNEPSVFNGPETTMPKDNLHFGNWEHRDVHNLNGLTFINSSFQGLALRDDPKHTTPMSRPFILTRSFYAGSQRMGAMWTGDNEAKWSHLHDSIPMILQQGVSGFPFAGADVAGFFGNPTPELSVRWYQAGAFYPFFRAHAHIDARRREPYLYEPSVRYTITQALRLRYSLLPSWYTAFWRASVDGSPIVRPMWWSYPHDAAGFAVDDQMSLADTGLLVKPVTEEGQQEQTIYLPALAPSTSKTVTHVPRVWYDYFTYKAYSSPGKSVTVPASIDSIPLLMGSGHIFVRRDRPRRSSGLMRWDPFTLVVVLDPEASELTARGEFYYDDGESYDYNKGARIQRRLAFAGGALESIDNDLPMSTMEKSVRAAKEEYLAKTDSLVVEKIVVVGAPKKWANIKTVSISEEGKEAKVSQEATREAAAEFHAGASGFADWLVVKKPAVKVGRGWKIDFSAGGKS